MRNLLCLLPDGHIEVTHWAPHPCGGYYLVEAQVWGPRGFVGRAVAGEQHPQQEDR